MTNRTLRGDKSLDTCRLSGVLNYAVLDHAQGLTYRFGPNRGDGVPPLTAAENANGFAITFGYDERGFLTGIRDSAGRVLAVACNDQGRVLRITAPHPTEPHPTEPRQTVDLVAYAYNRRGELVSVTDALGQAAAYDYAEGLLVRETFKNGLRFYFEYAGSGSEARCVHTWGDEGIYNHRLVYDLEAKRTVVTNSLGYATTYQGNENGLVVETWNARGGVTLTEYNELLSETDPLGHATSYEYDERGNCLATAMLRRRRNWPLLQSFSLLRFRNGAIHQPRPHWLVGGFNAYSYVTDPLVFIDALGLSQTYWLEKALNTAGRPLQPGQTAHHIVQINNPSKYAQASRDLLARNGIHPDVAANGVRLWGTHPNQVALANHPSRITARATGNYYAGPHVHSPNDDKSVLRTLRQAEKKGLNIESTLEDIGRKMESGSWKKGCKGCGHR